MRRVSDGVLSHLDGVLASDDAPSMQDPPTTAASTSPLSVVAGRFQIDSLLGRGGMSEVFRAQDAKTGAMVALKVQNAGEDWMDARFEREASVLARLRHPSLVSYVDHGHSDDGISWIAAELIEGETLAEKLVRVKRLPLAEALSLTKDVAGALALLHREGLVHRDVKPGNIFVTHAGRGVLLDLGLLGVSGAVAGAQVGLTDTGALLGTVGYVAPEQARGERNVDARADVFALGCVLFECLAGKPPFGSTLAEVTAAFAMGCVPPLAKLPSNVPLELHEILREALAPNPQGRQRDAGAFVERFERLGEDPIASSGESSATQPRAPKPQPDIDQLMSATLAVEESARRKPALPFKSSAKAPAKTQIDLLYVDSAVRSRLSLPTAEDDRTAFANHLADGTPRSYAETLALYETALAKRAEAPLALVEGVLTPALDPVEALRATLAAFTPWLEMHATLHEPHESALRALRVPGTISGAIAAHHRERLEEAASRISTPASAEVSAMVRESLALSQSFLRVRAFGGTHLRAELVGGNEGQPVSVYLPEAAELPSIVAFPARALVVVRPRQAADETTEIVYKVVALARVMTRA